MLPTQQQVYFAVQLGAVALLAICACVVVVECRQCRADAVEERERRRRTKLNGIATDSQTIELIGARPNDERPPGVDWSISTWADKRGEYAPGDRGYASGRRV